MKVFHFNDKNEIVESERKEGSDEVDGLDSTKRPFAGYSWRYNGLFHEDRKTLIEWRLAALREGLESTLNMLESLKEQEDEQQKLIQKLGIELGDDNLLSH